MKTEREAYEAWLDSRHLMEYPPEWLDHPAPISYTWEAWQAGRAPLLKRIEELSVIADCNRCENLGKVNGCSHEFYCEGCKHHYRGLRDFYKGGTEK